MYGITAFSEVPIAAAGVLNAVIPVIGVEGAAISTSVNVFGSATTQLSGVYGSSNINDLQPSISVQASFATTTTGVIGNPMFGGAAFGETAFSGDYQLSVLHVGLQASGLVNDVHIAGNSLTTIDGLQASGAITDLRVTGSSRPPITGLSAVASTNDLFVKGDSRTAITGLSAVSVQNNVKFEVGISVYPIGQTTNGLVADLIISGDGQVTLTGVAGIGATTNVLVWGELNEPPNTTIWTPVVH